MQVFGILWNPFNLERSQQIFLTYGKKHAKLWTQQHPEGSGKQTIWQPHALSFGRFDVQNVHSAAFLPKSNSIALGLARGEILVLENGHAVRSLVAHKAGPQIIADDGSITYGGVRGMVLHRGNTLLVTAGAIVRQPSPVLPTLSAMCDEV